MLGIYFLTSGTRRGKILSLMVTSLLAFDATYLSFQILKCVECWFSLIPKKYFKVYLIIIHSVMRSSLISSIFMLMAIARVRLCAIQKPFQHNNAILSWRDRRSFWLRYCVPIVISSLILTSPLIFEIDDNKSDTDQADTLVTPTSMRLHPIYSLLYIGVLNLGILGLVPIAYLIYMAYQIQTELKQSRERRERLGSCQSSQLPTLEQTHELNTTAGLVGIIMGFIAFHAFRILITVAELCILLDPNKENSVLQGGGGVPIWFNISLSLNNLLLVIHATVNVVIYLKPNSKEVLRSLIPTRKGPANRNKLKQQRSGDDVFNEDKEPNERNKKSRSQSNPAVTMASRAFSSTNDFGRRKSQSFEETSLSISENVFEFQTRSQMTMTRRSTTWAIIEEV